MKKSVSGLEIYEIAPEGFAPSVQVAACYLEINSKVFLLQRAHGNLEPGKWGVPAGKLESNETPKDAAKRELLEETGISVGSDSQIKYINSLYIRKPKVDYIYHAFEIHIDQMPEIHLSHEHQGYLWASLKDIEMIALMDGAKEALQYYQSMKGLE